MAAHDPVPSTHGLSHPPRSRRIPSTPCTCSWPIPSSGSLLESKSGQGALIARAAAAATYHECRLSECGAKEVAVRRIAHPLIRRDYMYLIAEPYAFNRRTCVGGGRYLSAYGPAMRASWSGCEPSQVEAPCDL